MIGDVDGQEAADVRHVDGHLPRASAILIDGIDPVELAGLAVLAEQMDLVAELGERLGDARVIDVATRAAQQVAVEDQDLDRPRLFGNAAGELDYEALGAPEEVDLVGADLLVDLGPGDVVGLEQAEDEEGMVT
ncbi:MAG: hypothetical protein ACR2OC_03580 [Solirubrobacterales bacterium]